MNTGDGDGDGDEDRDLCLFIYKERGRSKADPDRSLHLRIQRLALLVVRIDDVAIRFLNIWVSLQNETKRPASSSSSSVCIYYGVIPCYRVL